MDYITIKKMKVLGKMMMLLIMQGLIQGDLFLSTTRKRRSQEAFSLWVKQTCVLLLEVVTSSCP